MRHQVSRSSYALQTISLGEHISDLNLTNLASYFVFPEQRRMIYPAVIILFRLDIDR